MVGGTTVALLWTAMALATPVAAQSPRVPPSFTQWARTNAIPLHSVDDPYVDSSFAFLRPLVGSARVLALGELIHRGHEPLEFRNEVIRYAVTHLGFTAVALESGFTEAAVVDSFIQGGAGKVDSVLKAGLSWNFGTLPENREMVLWLREHNAHAGRKVRLYGFDLTGADPANLADLYLGAPQAVFAALEYLEQVSPVAGAHLRSRLVPLMGQFTPYRYVEYSSEERTRLRAGLDSLDRVLIADSGRDVQASSAFYYARARRNVWMALRLNDVLALTASSSPAVVRARTVMRDSLMAENIRWALRTEGDSGRLLVWAHNAHLMNAPEHTWQLDPGTNRYVPVGAPLRMAGQYLRAALGANEVVIGATSSRTIGWDASPSDSGSFDAALATVGLPTFVIDLRTGDRNSQVADMLRRAWPFRITTTFEPIVPREAADAIVYFAQVALTRDH
jgi:erythromycin esterase